MRRAVRIAVAVFLLSLGASSPAPAAVLTAAGDIACAPGTAVTTTTCRHAETAKLLADSDVIAPLGDNQ